MLKEKLQYFFIYQSTSQLHYAGHLLVSRRRVKRFGRTAFKIPLESRYAGVSGDATINTARRGGRRITNSDIFDHHEIHGEH